MLIGFTFFLIGLITMVLSSNYAYKTIKAKFRDKEFVLKEGLELSFGNYYGVGFFILVGIGLMFAGLILLSEYFYFLDVIMNFLLEKFY
ncbi:hypothetical protein [Gottfriedia solisilvae]|uniref:Uncharacterized protein n=1 Tax=Gottfriedia solisilvae TaxID=1516104 RepID=A0A8J3AGJ5_9BACI|nr:hypothetical protein [Gottfriedia solisilvae]GGI12923.1 hypothetical protein GCM10007380_15340 [Gottfriedia solisilvae]